jgi:preprotein translocase subunit SecA
MFDTLLAKIFGTKHDRELKKLRPIVAQINSLEPSIEKLSDAELAAKTVEFRQRLAQGETLDDLMLEAFAVCREAARRTVHMRHFDVQLIGGAVLHQGKIAEMKTGEGKTLVATLPVYLNALDGKGVHVVTVNDYLARRDSEWMGRIYKFLGLSVGLVVHGLDDEERRHSYACDVTYGTNNEFGFDYLRDNMKFRLEDCTQRPFNFAIVDEVDSILIDEARTPLIISGPSEESTDKYYKVNAIIPRLIRGEVIEGKEASEKYTTGDYTVDEKHRSAALTEEGVSKVEKLLGVTNLYDPESIEMNHHVQQGLRAHVLYERDRDYLVKDGEVIIVDEFTGRLMPGRRWSDGLHQAVEAKEGVKIEKENQTLATVTFQNYFRMYKKLAGMTGTAMTESEEFFKIYRLDVVPIPTNKPMQRQDMTDQVYRTEEAKFRAVVTEIQESHERGRPVLVGTISVERSEHLAALLERAGVDHQVLNAKQHEREAQVIAQAGRPGMVTIATNMAGRGVDILLGGNPEGLVGEDLKRQGIDPIAVPTAEYVRMVEEKVKAVCQPDREKVLAQGGLHIIGTERHEARRIDNQLRGRAGRQGDPGSSRFFLSLEDELMRRAGGNTVSGLMNRLGMDEDVPIEAGLVAKVIESAQSKMEGYNFDIRKHVVQYDDVMNTQRTVIYGERIKVLESDDLRASILDMVGKELDRVVNRFAASNYSEEWDMDGLMRGLRAILPTKISEKDLAATARTELLPRLREEAEAAFAEMETQFNAIPIGDGEVFGITFGQQLLGATKKKPGPIMPQIERILLLGTIDHLWVEHLTILDDLREGIGLRAFGQKDPLVEYKNEAYGMFQELTGGIERTVARTAFHVGVVRAGPQATQRQISTNKDESGREPVRKTAVGVPPADGKMPKKAMCWCGSGKRFEDCHGRRDKQGKKLDVLAEPAAERVVSAPVAQARQQVNAWDKKGKKHKR